MTKRVDPSDKSILKLSIPADGKLDFGGKAICSNPKEWALLQSSLQIESEAGLRGACRVGF